MFSPLDDPHVADWFRRLDAAWRRMPPDEQTRQREEVQQHLEGLVAANVTQGQPLDAAWSAALVQFGDPTQIGRKMCREWEQARTGFHADMAAILFGLSLQVLMQCIVIHLPIAIYHMKGVHRILFYGGQVLVCAAIGLAFPSQAIKTAFWNYLLWGIQWWISLGVFTYVQHISQPLPLSVMFVRSTLLWPMWLLALWVVAYHVTVAYLASVTKRGWYKPTWEDFKLTWPKRRQVG